jgi:hypothetical protein
VKAPIRNLNNFLPFRIYFLFLTALFACAPQRVQAQDETPTTVTVQNRSGDLPFSSSIGIDIEHVDVGSGNLILHIPLAPVKGRGMDFNFGLNYDARYWITAQENQMVSLLRNFGMLESATTCLTLRRASVGNQHRAASPG